MKNVLIQCFAFFISFFQDGLKTADKLKQYIEKLASDLYNVCTSLFNINMFDLVKPFYFTICIGFGSWQ